MKKKIPRAITINKKDLHIYYIDDQNGFRLSHRTSELNFYIYGIPTRV